MALFGYARVSTEGQTLVGQVAELRAGGASEVFKEKLSGAVIDRPQLRKLLGKLSKGHVLLVTATVEVIL